MHSISHKYPLVNREIKNLYFFKKTSFTLLFMQSYQQKETCVCGENAQQLGTRLYCIYKFGILTRICIYKSGELCYDKNTS